MARIYTLVNQKGGVGKTTTAISMISRAASVDPPVRFFIVDKDGEYNSLSEHLGAEKTLKVPWNRFFEPGAIPWEDYLGEFGWQKTWWNAKILIHALKILYAQNESVTKNKLQSAITWVKPEKLGFNKKEEEFESYRMQVINSVGNSKLIPDGEAIPLDPVELLRDKNVVIMDLSVGKDTWSQKHLVVSQVLKKIFGEAHKI